MNRNLKTLLQKLSPYRKRIFSIVSGAGIVVFSLFIYSLFPSQKTPSLYPQTMEGKAPALTKEEISTETNQLIDYPALNQHFCRIVAEIQEGTIHVCGDPVAVELKTPAERETGTPYLRCQVKPCLNTTPQKKCAHHNYLDCPQPDCAFFELEQRQFYDYCRDHTCQSYSCQQLVVSYEDGCWAKYCRNCLPNPNSF
jgi:hypothetical protein